MNENIKAINDIAKQKRELELAISRAIQTELAKFNTKTGLIIDSMDVSINSIHTLGGSPKNIVESVGVDVSYSNPSYGVVFE